MSYRVRDDLWALLVERDRTASWLARRAGYTPQYLRMLRAGLRDRVSDTFAQRVATVMEVSVETLFERIDDS